MFLYFFLSALLFFLIILSDVRGKMKEFKPVLPKAMGLWTRPDSPRVVNAESIFDYMDGAGELYIGYRFDHLESYEYKAKAQKNILVELYFMKSADDAYGLLSLDWGGKPVELDPSAQEKASPDNFLWPRALYGEGLLRIWSDNIYARIMAYLETAESKEAVLSLGRAVVKGRKNPPPPQLLVHLPSSFQPDWKLLQDRVSFFRNHLVLNSIYYLSQENILDLDLSTEAVTALYEREDPPEGRARIRFLQVKYPDQKQASKALAHFHKAYLPEHPYQKEKVKAFHVEDGWLGYRHKNRTLSFIFECPEQETVRTIMDQVK